MSIASVAVEKKALTYFVMVVLLIAGAFSFFSLGWLEDPEFTVKTAAIVTMYPGASAQEVELEVTDPIEIAIQEMPQLKDVYSCSRPGMSLIKVDLQASYKADALPQIWDELRKKVGDVAGQLPPGVGAPAVSDDFGDVYGFLMAVTSDGFSPAELERYVDHIKKELSVVDGVARVELWGDQSECLYVEVREAQLSAFTTTTTFSGPPPPWAESMLNNRQVASEKEKSAREPRRLIVACVMMEILWRW